MMRKGEKTTNIDVLVFFTDLKDLGGFVLKVMKKFFFSIFCFYLVELSLDFQNMCCLCIFDSPLELGNG